MKERILVSACLLGIPCRYDGKSKPCEAVIRLKEKYELIPMCPEVYGGLETPRIPSERVGDRVIMKSGRDVTENYFKGAFACVDICSTLDIKKAILKSRSPSCGSGKIYDGSFTSKLVMGDGVTAQMLKSEGIQVFTEEELNLFVDFN